MITPEYCVTMARYNQWQNNGLCDLVDVMDEDELRTDRGAFFKSILGTLAHIMAGDRLWLNRLDASFSVPDFSAGGDTDQDMDGPTWVELRRALDVEIVNWANALSENDLAGDVPWRSMLMEKDFVHNRALCVTHFFNHQTHHRGQVHAMMTAAGQRPIDTDIILTPET